MSEIKAIYEAVVVYSLKLGEDGIAAHVEKFKNLIEKNAKMEAVDEWGKRRLAYPINYETEGYYVLYTFEANCDFPLELERNFNISEGVIRSLIVRKDA